MEYERKSSPKKWGKSSKTKIKTHGKKRCPSCKSNSVIDGKCSCGWGKTDLSKYMDFPIITPEESLVLGLALMAKHSGKKTKEETD